MVSQCTILVWYNNPYHTRMVIPYAYTCMVRTIRVWYKYAYGTEQIYQFSVTHYKFIMRDIPDPFIFREAHKRVGYARLVIASDLQNCCSKECLSTAPWCFLLSSIS